MTVTRSVSISILQTSSVAEENTHTPAKSVSGPHCSAGVAALHNSSSVTTEVLDPLLGLELG